MLNSTAISVAFVEALTSWGAVYTALFLPAVLMLANFVFGDCFLSEAISVSQHTDASLYTRYRLIGRGSIAMVLVLLTWEYYVYFFTFRTNHKTPRGSVTTAAACNPLYVLWNLADTLSVGFSALHPSTDLFSCTWNDVTFLVLFSGFAATYLMMVFSVPQVTKAEAHSSQHRGSAKQAVEVSYCRKCASHVKGKCHHCYLIGNCVGHKNKWTFLTCLWFGVGNLSVLLYRCGEWAFYQSSRTIHLGLVFALVALIFLSALLSFQLMLCWRGVNSLAVWKHSRQTGKSFWWVLLKSPVEDGRLVDVRKMNVCGEVDER